MYKLKTSIIGKPITITYTRESRDWICRVLEYDLIGVGGTKKEALDELCENLWVYFEDVLTSNERTEFEHRAEAKEFNNPKKEKYVIIAIVARRQKEPIPERFRSL